MKFYRYETVTYASGDEYFESHGITKLEIREYNLYKETPKGYWIGYGYLGKLSSKGKWVSKTSKKRYAYPTKEEAIVNYIKRTEKRIGFLNNNLHQCKKGIELAKQFLEDEKSSN